MRLRKSPHPIYSSVTLLVLTIYLVNFIFPTSPSSLLAHLSTLALILLGIAYSAYLLKANLHKNTTLLQKFIIILNLLAITYYLYLITLF
jgi:hypothetical protein